MTPEGLLLLTVVLVVLVGVTLALEYACARVRSPRPPAAKAGAFSSIRAPASAGRDRGRQP